MLKTTRKNKLLFLVFFADFIALTLSWTIAYLIRFEGPFGEAQAGLQLTFFILYLFFIPLFFINFIRKGLYDVGLWYNRVKETSLILTSSTKSFFTFIIFLYFLAPARISRIHLMIFLLLTPLVVVFFRTLLRIICEENLVQNLCRSQVILMGDGPQLAEFVEKNSGPLCKILAWVNPPENSEALLKKYNIDKFEGSFDDANNKYAPQKVIVGPGSQSAKSLSDFLEKNYQELLPIEILPDLSYSIVGHSLSEVNGIPVITINRPPFTMLDQVIKRAFDIIVTSTGLIVISPLLILLAILVKLSSKGPILYGQVRVGLDGKEFKMWKFRSMVQDAEIKTGAVWAQENDQRRTKLGTFLRSTSLDELPQLFNVLKGDMSLVGPRPERPFFVNEFKKSVPLYMLRHKVRAGITGWAQVNGWRGNTDLGERILCDIYYIKNWSIWFDIKILFMTIWKGLIHKNAY